MNELVLNKRLNKTANEVKQKRREGKVPGVVYGKKLGSLMFEIGEMELVEELSKSGEHGVLRFDLDGYNGTAIIKEVQKDPISHKVMHIDLKEVSRYGELQTEVPIKFQGKEFLSKKGIVIQNQKDSVKVSCTAQNIPKAIMLDVSNAKLGSVYKLSDLEVGSEISIIDNLSTVFASVVTRQFIATENSDEE
ncbi:50S ribosomal protein L25 [Clostridium gelidum]|uniref:Large ribosomal subunit protein bL25 n=1 Tax=Clostridium gelidum TaxID=704125 RepID=A0ABN6J526_9CLOT|nr:50S ribosomal protein L25 [Clostridium gelidum]BCZ48368.1 50S ribosomal protein L25 [Clostridium gelidum]